jgi:hypothetical protein
LRQLSFNFTFNTSLIIMNFNKNLYYYSLRKHYLLVEKNHAIRAPGKELPAGRPAILSSAPRTPVRKLLVHPKITAAALFLRMILVDPNQIKNKSNSVECVSEPAVVEGPIITVSENPPIGSYSAASSNPDNISVPALFGNKRKKVYSKISKEENISASSLYGGAEQIFSKGITAPPVIERTDRVSLQTLLPPCKRKMMMMTIMKI